MLFAAVSVTVQLSVVAGQVVVVTLPLQPVNLKVDAAVAVSVTELP